MKVVLVVSPVRVVMRLVTGSSTALPAMTTRLMRVVLVMVGSVQGPSPGNVGEATSRLRVAFNAEVWAGPVVAAVVTTAGVASG